MRAFTESVTKDKEESSETCDTMTPDIRELHRLISDNSVDLAIELVGRSNVVNTQDGDGYLLLSLAAKAVPPSRAVLLVDALFNAGVSIYLLQYIKWGKKKNDLFVACDIGVHPIIFDALLKQRTFYEPWWTWWTDKENFFNYMSNAMQGYFHIACVSGNYDLVEHLLEIKSREGSVRDLLDEAANNIMEILDTTLVRRSENYNIKLISLCRRYFDDFPNGYSITDIQNEFTESFNLDGVIGKALNQGMQSFVLEFANLYPSQRLNGIIWKWTIRNSDTVLHPRLKLRALAYTPSIEEEEEEEAEHAKAKARRANFSK